MKFVVLCCAMAISWISTGFVWFIYQYFQSRCIVTGFNMFNMSAMIKPWRKWANQSSRCETSIKRNTAWNMHTYCDVLYKPLLSIEGFCLSIRYIILFTHYCDVIMGAIVSQVTSLTIVYPTVYPGADQRKHQSSASQAFVREFIGDRWHKRPVTRETRPFHYVSMNDLFSLSFIDHATIL